MSKEEKFKIEEYWTISGIFENLSGEKFSSRLIEFDQKKADYLSVPIDPFYLLNQMYKHLIYSKQNYSQLCHN